MAQSFLPQQRDLRTFGAMQARLLDDLNRPDLANEATLYLQDAIRYFARMPFFFTEIDNRTTPQWVASAYYPQGSTVYGTGSDGYVDAFVALSPGIQLSGTSEPAWPNEIFAPLPGSEFFTPPDPTDWGVVSDGGVLWGNIGQYRRGYHTQLTTIPNVNRYVPPLDWVSPYMIQMTTANLRLRLEQIPFSTLSAYDVVIPAPIAAYPTFWSWWGQEIYCWVYPAGFYPITLSYVAGPLPPTVDTDTNYWTTIAERLIRKYAQGAISREILYDQAAAQLSLTASSEELSRLKAQTVAQLGYRIPPGSW